MTPARFEPAQLLAGETVARSDSTTKSVSDQGRPNYCLICVNPSQNPESSYLLSFVSERKSAFPYVPESFNITSDVTKFSPAMGDAGSNPVGGRVFFFNKIFGIFIQVDKNK